MDMNAVWQDIVWSVEALCRDVAPELAQWPLYVVRGSTLPEGLSGGRGCWGFTAPNLDIFLRPSLGDAWQGRGMAIVLNDRLIELDDGPFSIFQLAAGIAIHELAHVLTENRPDQLRRAQQSPREWRQLADVGARIAATPWIEEADENGAALCHGAAFMRVAIHLRTRAWRVAGVCLVWDLLALSGDARLPSAFLDALGSEPLDWIDRSLTELLDRPLPPGFAGKMNSVLAKESKMGITNLLESIAKRLHARQLDHARSYGEIVRQVADGEEPEITVLEELLRSAQKTSEDLARDVGIVHRRRELHACIERGAAAQRQKRVLEQKQQTALAIFESARKACAETIDPIQEELRSLDQLQRDATAARQELLKTCNDPRLLEEMGGVMAKIRSLSHRREELAEAIQRHSETASSHRRAAEKNAHPDVDGLRKQQLMTAADAEKSRAQKSEQVDEIDRQLRALHGTEGALRLSMLEP